MKTKLSKKSGTTRSKLLVQPARTRIKKILAPTDFSAESLAGVRYAGALADKLSASIALLHVIEPPSRRAGMEAVVLAYDDSKLTALALAELDKMSKREKTGVLSLTSYVRTGNPFHEITMAAREHAADLIVIATHGYTAARRILLGSTAERVVRHAPCPVLTVPARPPPKTIEKRASLKLKKILVPIDFSKISKDAFPLATTLAARFGAEISLLHIVEKFPIDYLLGHEFMSDTIAPLMKQANAEVERIAESVSRLTGVKVSAIVRSGTPFEEICGAAQTLGADMIVLTTHGYAGLKHVWLGSTAERVVRHSRCPVLVVRELNGKPV